MAKQLTRNEYQSLRRQMDTAQTPDDLLQAASAYGLSLTKNQLETIRDMAQAEVTAEEARRVDDENESLASDLRSIQNDGIRQSAKFVNWLLYKAAIVAVFVLFAGEVLRLTPVISTMLDVPWFVSWIPTAMILVGYYVTALIGKHERKANTGLIVTARMKAKANKYLTAETLTPDEEREGRAAAERIRTAKRAGMGYGMVEWTLFVGLHALTIYHTIEIHTGTDDLGFMLIGSIMSIFLLLIVSKMMVTHIFTTSQKAIVTGVQGFDRDAAYEDAYGRALYNAINSKAAKATEGDESPLASPPLRVVNGSQ